MTMSENEYIIKLLELICQYFDLEYEGIRKGVIYRYQIVTLADGEAQWEFPTHREAQHFIDTYGLSNKKYSIKQVEYFL